MKRIILIASVVLCMWGCRQNDGFRLEGSLTNGAGKTIYIEELSPDGPVFLDSIRLDDNGHFTYQHKLSYQTFYNLHSSPVDYVVLLPRAGERIEVTGDFQSLQWTYRVSGSEESTLLWQLQDYCNYGISVLSEIVDKDRDNRTRLGADSKAYRDAKEETDSIFRETAAEQGEYITRFIQEHRGSLATLIALYKQFNQHDLLSPQANFDYYELVLEGLEESLPDNPHTIQFKNHVENLRHRYGKPSEALDMVFDGQ